MHTSTKKIPIPAARVESRKVAVGLRRTHKGTMEQMENATAFHVETARDMYPFLPYPGTPAGFHLMLPQTLQASTFREIGPTPRACREVTKFVLPRPSGRTLHY